MDESKSSREEKWVGVTGGWGVYASCLNTLYVLSV